MSEWYPFHIDIKSKTQNLNDLVHVVFIQTKDILSRLEHLPSEPLTGFTLTVQCNLGGPARGLPFTLIHVSNRCAKTYHNTVTINVYSQIIISQQKTKLLEF